jgi:hypothetical protein
LSVVQNSGISRVSFLGGGPSVLRTLGFEGEYPFTH